MRSKILFTFVLKSNIKKKHSFIGHVGPGMGYVVLGSFLWMRSLREIKFVERLHSKTSLMVLGFLHIFVGIIFAAVELKDVYFGGWRPTTPDQ